MRNMKFAVRHKTLNQIYNNYSFLDLILEDVSFIWDICAQHEKNIKTCNKIRSAVYRDNALN